MERKVKAGATSWRQLAECIDRIADCGTAESEEYLLGLLSTSEEGLALATSRFVVDFGEHHLPELLELIGSQALPANVGKNILSGIMQMQLDPPPLEFICANGTPDSVREHGARELGRVLTAADLDVAAASLLVIGKERAVVALFDGALSGARISPNTGRRAFFDFYSHPSVTHDRALAEQVLAVLYSHRLVGEMSGIERAWIEEDARALFPSAHDDVFTALLEGGR